MNNKKTLFISVVAVIVFIASVTAISYAFYTASVTPNIDNETQINDITANIDTTLQDDNVVTVKDMIPGDKLTKTFSITNNNGPTLQYKIAVLDLTNSFSRYQDVTYELTENGEKIGGGEFPHDPRNNDLSTSVRTINQGETKSYTLTITYKNDPSVSQMDDMNKTISGKIFIKGV